MAETSNSKVVSILNIDNEDYYIKDEKARGDISTINTTIADIATSVHTETLVLEDEDGNSSERVRIKYVEPTQSADGYIRIEQFSGNNLSHQFNLPIAGDNSVDTIAINEEQFGHAYYNSGLTPPQIEFYSRENWNNTTNLPGAGNPICRLDASAFIKDAMVSSVAIDQAGENLVITWNSDSGISTPTTIPLTSIFNPANYYDKDDVDGLISGVEAGLVDIVDNLTTNDATKALSAKQGKVLQDNKANKSEMSVSAGSGNDLGKTTVTLKTGTSATLLDTNHPAATISANDKTTWSGKQDAISDLATIRSGAGAGATAIQGVKVNGSALTPDSNKVVDVTVPVVVNNLTTTTAGSALDATQGKALSDALDDKVDKVSGKGLSTNDYTTTEKNKLAGIAAGAEVNVNADWNATSGDAQILNKPTIPTVPTNVSSFTNDVDYIAFVGYDSTNKKLSFTTTPSAS